MTNIQDLDTMLIEFMMQLALHIPPVYSRCSQIGGVQTLSQAGSFRSAFLSEALSPLDPNEHINLFLSFFSP